MPAISSRCIRWNRHGLDFWTLERAHITHHHLQMHRDGWFHHCCFHPESSCADVQHLPVRGLQLWYQQHHPRVDQRNSWTDCREESGVSCDLQHIWQLSSRLYSLSLAFVS